MDRYGLNTPSALEENIHIKTNKQNINCLTQCLTLQQMSLEITSEGVGSIPAKIDRLPGSYFPCFVQLERSEARK